MASSQMTLQASLESFAMEVNWQSKKHFKNGKTNLQGSSLFLSIFIQVSTDVKTSVHREIKEMLASRIIKTSTSDWAVSIASIKRMVL